MILDTLQNLRYYCGLHPLFASAMEFLQRPDIETLPDGRRDIQGEKLYASIVRKGGIRSDEAVLEAHRRYIDIQLLLEGEERIGWRDFGTGLHEKGPYDSEKDIIFFLDPPQVSVPLHPGMFALFFPSDAHAPMISESKLHKIVVKVSCL